MLTTTDSKKDITFLSKKFPDGILILGHCAKAEKEDTAAAATSAGTESAVATAAGSSSVAAVIGSVTLQFPLTNVESNKVFSSLPEWIVEDMADFALFSLQ